MNELAGIGSYTLALAIAAALPGPGMTTLVARSVSGGTACGLAMLAGLVCGDLVYLTTAVFGLAVIAHAYASIFSVIRIASAGYLLWLAIQFWRHRPREASLATGTTRQSQLASAVAGLTLTLGNPKTIGFYLALVPVVLPLERVTVAAWALLLVPITVAVLSLIGGAFVLGASRARYLLASAAAQRVVFRTAAVIMTIAALGIMFEVF